MAKKLRHLSASFWPRPKPSTASRVSLVMSTVCTRYALEAAVFERIGFVAGLLEALGVELVAVDDQDAAGAQVGEVGHQRGRVHRHQRVDRVAGRVNVLARKMDLESADARLGAARGANLGREVGERGDVVARPVRWCW